MRKPLSRIAGALLLAGLASISATSQATTLPYKNLQQLAAEADGIVIGTVRTVQTVALSPGDIHTYVTLQAQDLISGQLNQRELVLKLQGGFDGKQGLQIDGAPQFTAGERVLVFVQGNGRDLVPFVGWSQGVFRIVRDAQSGEDTVLDADHQRVVGLQGLHLLRDAKVHSDVQLHGAPPLALVRQAEVEASAGATDDGSPVTEQRASAAPLAALPTLSLQSFISEVRQRAGSGRALASVGAADTAPAAAVVAERSAQPVQAADHAVARPAEGAVVEPVARPQSPSQPVTPARQR